MPDIKIKKYSELLEDDIVAFNTKQYRIAYTKEMIRWRFRIGYSPSTEPLYAVLDDKIVGQAGLMPNKWVYKNREGLIIWFNMFIVDASFKGQGIGKKLTEAWMQLTNTQVTNCNDHSMAVFKKYGWDEEYSTCRYAYPLHLSKVAASHGWKGIRMILLKALQPFYSLRYLRYKRSKPKLTASPLGHIHIQTLMQYFKDLDSDKQLCRDQDWISWRLYESYLSDQYYVMFYQEAVLIFRIFCKGDLKRIHIVYQTPSAPQSVLEYLTGEFMKYAVAQKADLIWALTNVPALCKVYDKYLPQKLYTRMAFYSSDQECMNSFKSAPLQVQAIDSDYDSMYHG